MSESKKGIREGLIEEYGEAFKESLDLFKEVGVDFDSEMVFVTLGNSPTSYAVEYMVYKRVIEMGLMDSKGVFEKVRKDVYSIGRLFDDVCEVWDRANNDDYPDRKIVGEYKLTIHGGIRFVFYSVSKEVHDELVKISDKVHLEEEYVYDKRLDVLKIDKYKTEYIERFEEEFKYLGFDAIPKTYRK